MFSTSIGRPAVGSDTRAVTVPDVRGPAPQHSGPRCTARQATHLSVSTLHRAAWRTAPEGNVTAFVRGCGHGKEAE
jgi:hypothetical protein